MENEVTRALVEMREAQIIVGRVAIAKRDVSELREAQANTDAIDRALSEERALMEKAAVEERAKQTAKRPGRHQVEYDPYEAAPGFGDD